MKQHHVRRGKLESDVKENRGINSDLREKMNHMEKDNQIEIRKVKGEWAMKSERVQVLVCEKEGREKILEQLKSEKESWKCKEKEFDYQIESLKGKLEEGVKDWEGEKKVWGDQMKQWKMRGYQWSEEKRALDSECLKLRGEARCVLSLARWRDGEMARWRVST